MLMAIINRPLVAANCVICQAEEEAEAFLAGNLLQPSAGEIMRLKGPTFNLNKSPKLSNRQEINMAK